MGIWKLRDLAGWLHRERVDKDRQAGGKAGRAGRRAESHRWANPELGMFCFLAASLQPVRPAHV